MALICAHGDFLPSNDNLLGEKPAESVPESAWMQFGHYVNTKGSLMPGKSESEILNICRRIPGRRVGGCRGGRRERD